MYKYLIVDSVWFDAVFAHEAKRLRKSVFVMERREHMSGNVYRRRSLLPRQQRAQLEPLKQCAALVKQEHISSSMAGLQSISITI